MPFISVTRLRLRSVRFLPPFLLYFLRIRRQVRSAPGFRGGSILADRACTFWTLTSWDRQEHMRAFMTAAPHLPAMSRLIDWCDEAAVVHWDQPGEALPSWEEADRRLRENGRPSKVRHPSPLHASLDFRPPRVVASQALRPATKRPGAGT